MDLRKKREVVATLPRGTRKARLNQGTGLEGHEVWWSFRTLKGRGAEGISGSDHPSKTEANPEGPRRTEQPGPQGEARRKGSGEGSIERKGAKAYPKVTLTHGESRDKKTRLLRRVSHGRCWTRTSDPIDVSDVLCQLS